MESYKLEDCCEILDSQRVPITGSNRNAGEYPYYGANGVQDYVDDYIFDDELVLLAEDGGNFGSKTRPIAYRVSGKSWVNNHAHVLKPKAEVNVDYLCYSLMFYDVGGMVNGATRQKLTQAAMRQMLIPKRTLQEQLEIVDIIKKTQNIIADRKRQLELFDDLIKARFVEMFGDPLEPKKYEQLGDIALLERGRFSPRPRNDPRFFDGEYPFIQTGDISVSNHRLSNYKQTLNEKGIKVSKRFEKGTIVIAIVGATIGATAILERYVYAPDSVIGISPYKYKNVYLETLLQFWQPELLRSAPECARPNINLAILNEIPILSADIVKQNQFATFVTQVDKSKLLLISYDSVIINVRQYLNSKIFIHTYRGRK